MFGGMPPDLYTALSTENITYNHHMKGVAPETYKNYPKLNKFFKPLSINTDDSGKEYISTVEGKSYV